MEFGSKYALADEVDEALEMELEELAYSDDENELDSLLADLEAPQSQQRAQMPPPPPPGVRAMPAVAKRARVRRADANVVALQLGTLGKGAKMATGDPNFCKECNAALSHISVVEEKEGGEQTWQCEFCGSSNDMVLDEAELPKALAEVVEFVLHAPAHDAANDNQAAQQEEGDAKHKASVVFVADNSGSMCVTTECESTEMLKGMAERQQKLAALNNEHADQYMPGQRRDVMYISRLDCVKAAISSQLEELAVSKPETPVGLITFNNEVSVIGDGLGNPTVLAGDKLNKFEALQEEAKKLKLEKPITDTKAALSEKLFALEENGATALGPAALVAVQVAAARPGSKVILCTDGRSNVGLGQLEEAQQIEEAQAFFQRLADIAKDAGVSVSTISIEGTDCRLEQLGSLAEQTGGGINIVNPLNLTKEFATILADEVVATNCRVTLVLHKGVFVRNENNILQKKSDAPADDEKEKSNSAKQSGKPSRVQQDVGNATSNTEVTFEYGIDAAAQLDKKLKKLPFQVQIEFTRPDTGLRYIRTITKQLEITTDREKQVEVADIQVLGNHSAQTSAQIAQDGGYSNARLNAFRNRALLKSVAAKQGSKSKEAYSRWKGAVKQMDTTILQAQQCEMMETGGRLSDDEMDDVMDDMAQDDFSGFTFQSSAAPSAAPVRSSRKPRSKKGKARSAARSDKTANAIYNMKTKPIFKKK